ncbi:hypothetical protein DL93DRAFT_575663 [Clavulina sp. PMI_390]|nr:hypothetical protein DL93DRAFT_575663 [Clavulina sp. PMI_390]
MNQSTTSTHPISQGSEGPSGNTATPAPTRQGSNLTALQLHNWAAGGASHGFISSNSGSNSADHGPQDFSWALSSHQPGSSENQTVAPSDLMLRPNLISSAAGPSTGASFANTSGIPHIFADTAFATEPSQSVGSHLEESYRPNFQPTSPTLQFSHHGRNTDVTVTQMASHRETRGETRQAIRHLADSFSRLARVVENTTRTREEVEQAPPPYTFPPGPLTNPATANINTSDSMPPADHASSPQQQQSLEPPFSEPSGHTPAREALANAPNMELAGQDPVELNKDGAPAPSSPDHLPDHSASGIGDHPPQKSQIFSHIAEPSSSTELGPVDDRTALATGQTVVDPIETSDGTLNGNDPSHSKDEIKMDIDDLVAEQSQLQSSSADKSPPPSSHHSHRDEKETPTTDESNDTSLLSKQDERDEGALNAAARKDSSADGKHVEVVPLVGPNEQVQEVLESGDQVVATEGVGDDNMSIDSSSDESGSEYQDSDNESDLGSNKGQDAGQTDSPTDHCSSGDTAVGEMEVEPILDPQNKAQKDQTAGAAADEVQREGKRKRESLEVTLGNKKAKSDDVTGAEPGDSPASPASSDLSLESEDPVQAGPSTPKDPIVAVSESPETELLRQALNKVRDNKPLTGSHSLLHTPGKAEEPLAWPKYRREKPQTSRSVSLYRPALQTTTFTANQTGPLTEHGLLPTGKFVIHGRNTRTAEAIDAVKAAVDLAKAQNRFHQIQVVERDKFRKLSPHDRELLMREPIAVFDAEEVERRNANPKIPSVLSQSYPLLRPDSHAPPPQTIDFDLLSKWTGECVPLDAKWIDAGLGGELHSLIEANSITLDGVWIDNVGNGAMYHAGEARQEDGGIWCPEKASACSLQAILAASNLRPGKWMLLPHYISNNNHFAVALAQVPHPSETEFTVYYIDSLDPAVFWREKDVSFLMDVLCTMLKATNSCLSDYPVPPKPSSHFQEADGGAVIEGGSITEGSSAPQTLQQQDGRARHIMVPKFIHHTHMKVRVLEKISKQTNGASCGLFTLRYVKELLLHLDTLENDLVSSSQ